MHPGTQASLRNRHSAAESALVAARLNCLHYRPYLRTAVLAMQPVRVSPDGPLTTMAVDRWWRLYWNPAFVLAHDVGVLSAVIEHEVLHLLQNHARRREDLGADPERWNLSTDAVINDQLLSCLEPPRALPGWCITPERLGVPRGLLAEEVYARLPQPAAARGDREGDPGDGRAAGSGRCGAGAGGAPEPWELAPGEPDGAGDPAHAVDPVAAEAVRRQTAEDVLDHQREGRGRGRVPAGLVRWAQATLRPRVPWRRELRAATRNAVAAASGRLDYTFARMSRRQAALPDLRLPGLVERWPAVGVLIDTSGSMGDGQTAQALAEVAGVLRTMGGRHHLRVFAVDAAVHTSQRVFRAAAVRLVGGGGTDLRVGIAAAEAVRPRLDVLVIVSDALTPWPAAAPAIPRVVLVNVGRGRPPPWPCRHLSVDPGDPGR